MRIDLARPYEYEWRGQMPIRPLLCIDNGAVWLCGRSPSQDKKLASAMGSIDRHHDVILLTNWYIMGTHGQLDSPAS